MNEFSYFEIFRLAVPETVLVIGALFLLLLDLVLLRDHPPEFRSAFLATTTAVVCGFGIAWLQVIPQSGSVLEGMLVMNPVTALVKQCLLGLTALTALISWRVTFTRHLGEYFALLLLATVGMLFLASAQHLLMIFVARHLFYLRTVTFLTCGAVKMRFARFLVADAIAAFISVPIMMSLGYFAAEQAEDILNNARNITLWISAFAILIIAVLYFIHKRKSADAKIAPKIK